MGRTNVFPMHDRVTDLPEPIRPREKLQQLGPAALADEELLAIILRVGVAGMSAIEMGRMLIQKYGGLRQLASLNTDQLSQEHGIGLAKACQLAAIFEVGSRAARQSMLSATINSPEEIYNYMAPQLAHETKERVLVILFNNKQQVLRVIDLSSGSATQSICEPRDIIRHVLINQAVAFAVVHNHPSGDPSPSRADRDITHRTKKAAEVMNLGLIDHVIIGHPSSESADTSPYYSFSEHGLV
ncbi:RadC family protein [Persicirhabdus sediminis]|uniref:DNA repair protein RadC n=1 Tax=Persicirhabdus sediminis TaxID=454144 RepID=A0A8J7MCA2_9BACT|nr:DNA repair protein RadC [Persicirhabdus sediminis]MBK1790757.1 DNA repair protein RadC [Persicirhabdus sediminis]